MKKTQILTAAVVVTAVLVPAVNATGKIVVVGERVGPDVVPWAGASADSMRFQCLWFQSDINYAGYVNGVRLEKTNAASGRFNNVRVWLCHSKKTALEPNFANNYTGDTPLEVLNMRSVTVSGSGWFDLRITPNIFNYDNKRNLLMEIRWNDDDGYDVTCWRSRQQYSRCFAYNENATSGTVYNNGQRVRLHIGTMVGLEATSLGRVRAFYR